MPGEIAYALSRLLWEVPAPPALRAAAFRALAAMPNVTNLGPANGGISLRISFPPAPADKWPAGKQPAGTDHLVLVVDPDKATLASQTTYQGTTTVDGAEWTDTMPKIVTAPHK